MDNCEAHDHNGIQKVRNISLYSPLNLPSVRRLHFRWKSFYFYFIFILAVCVLICIKCFPHCCHRLPPSTYTHTRSPPERATLDQRSWARLEETLGLSGLQNDTSTRQINFSLTTDHLSQHDFSVFLCQQILLTKDFMLQMTENPIQTSLNYKVNFLTDDKIQPQAQFSGTREVTGDLVFGCVQCWFLPQMLQCLSPVSCRAHIHMPKTSLDCSHTGPAIHSFSKAHIGSQTNSRTFCIHRVKKD